MVGDYGKSKDLQDRGWSCLQPVVAHRPDPQDQNDGLYLIIYKGSYSCLYK